MTIHFNPFYDGEIFLSDTPRAMGQTWLGMKGLLEELEMRLGIRCAVKPAVEREADYLKALTPHIGGTVFEDSMEVDSIGVARILLGWRDDLVMAGWDGSCPDAESAKLSVLAAVEKDFHSPGTPDRWRNVCNESGTVSLSGAIRTLVVECPKEELPLLVRRTLELISSSGTVVEWKVDEEMKEKGICEPDVSKITLVQFEDVNDAYEWISRVEKFPADTVIVNRDNLRLNHTLGTWNKPLVHSSLVGSNPQLIQLFKLSMSILSNPLNIRNLLSYLQLPISPIPSSLRGSLAKLLIEQGGFGERVLRDDGEIRDDWDEMVRTFVFKDKDGNESESERRKKMPFLSPIRTDHSAGIRKEELMNYIAAMEKWLSGYLSKADLSNGQKTQFNEIQSCFKSLLTASATLSDIFRYEDLDKLVRQIYHSLDYSLQETQAGAMNVVRDIRGIATKPETLVWLDCQNDDPENDRYDFLGKTERDTLKSVGVDLPDFREHLSRVRAERIRLLNNAGKVILVSSSYDGTTRLGEHPVYAEAMTASAPIRDPEGIFEMREKKNADLPVDRFEPQKYIELGELGYKGRKESHTSLETLINHPFNYVVEYIARLPKQEGGQLKSVSLTLGLVAHHFFEHIITDGDRDQQRMRELTEVEYDVRMDAAIDATGLLLRLPENAVTLQNFRRELKESMIALLDVMEHLSLSPVGCELSFPEEDGKELALEGIGNFGARIDFLTMKDDEYVIIDFKWSQSKKYAEFLESDTSLQLELYRQTMMATHPERAVAGVGYFLMPKKQLVTSDFDEIPGSKLIQHVNQQSEQPLFERIRNSYRFRMEELRKGHIEEGEMMDFTDVPDSYAAKTKDQGLLPVVEGAGKSSLVKPSEQIYNPEKRKFKENDAGPSETATSHAVLKGRLK